MKEFSLSVRVYIEDTDAGGIVYYVNYLKFMERSRTELMRHLGFGKASVTEEGLLLVVKSAQVDYRSPARLDDELRVTATISKLARSYVVFKQQVLRGDELLCAGEIKVACVSRNADSGVMRPTSIPANMQEALKGVVPAV